MDMCRVMGVVNVAPDSFAAQIFPKFAPLRLRSNF